MESLLARLVEPDALRKDAYLEMAMEFRLAGEFFSYHDTALKDFDAYFQSLKDWPAGRNLPAGWVPMDSYWLIVGDHVIGESRLRHYLAGNLEQEGGHIGYAIRPCVRRRGFGTLLLAWTLEKARRLGLERVLITCDATNTGSARVIESNGGHLAGFSMSAQSGKKVLRYWIDLLPISDVSFSPQSMV